MSPQVCERQVPGGGACTPGCAHVRACVHTDPRGKRHRPGRREARAGRRAPLHTQPCPPPPPHPFHPCPRPQDSTGRLPFSSLHTFFFLLLGYMLLWGWLALSCKFPRLTGKQGVCGVGGVGGGTREGKVKEAPHPRLSPLSSRRPPPSAGVLLRLPPASAPRPPPQQPSEPVN